MTLSSSHSVATKVKFDPQARNTTEANEAAPIAPKDPAATLKPLVDTKKSKETLTRTLSTWGVIRGWDRATEKMNACFSNLLLDLQREERRTKEEAERKVREAEKRKQDLLKGKPFKLATMSRGIRIRRSPQHPSYMLMMHHQQ